MDTRDILLNPGPVNLTQRVRRALSRPDMCHREPDFSAIQQDIRKRLLEVYHLSSKRFASIVMTASGTAAVEAMIASFVPDNGRLLILSNGVYGERIARMARSHRISFRLLSFVWGQEIPSAQIENILKSDRRITHVAVVHHETTTGRLNDLQGIGRLCRKYGKRFLVDAVSSFGGEWIDFEKWGVDACAASSNKCLHGVAGAAFVVCRRDLFKNSPFPARSCYLDLGWYFQEQEKNSSPFTHAVQAFFAFQEALKEYRQQGGLAARIKLYRRRALMVRRLAKGIGLRLYLQQGPLSVILTAFYLPSGCRYGQVHDFLRKKGFIIYAGQGNLSSSIFRIANMGAVSDADFKRLFRDLKGLICRQ